MELAYKPKHNCKVYVRSHICSSYHIHNTYMTVYIVHVWSTGLISSINAPLLFINGTTCHHYSSMELLFITIHHWNYLFPLGNCSMSTNSLCRSDPLRWRHIWASLWQSWLSSFQTFNFWNFQKCVSILSFLCWNLRKPLWILSFETS